MKFGERLERYSVPEWHAHNILYDQIKSEIKDLTSNGNFSKRGYDALVESFQGEIDNVNLFVQCKLGAIEYALKQNDSMVTSLSADYSESKFIQLQREVQKLAHEIENLSKFISAQFTGFRKLIKKYRRHVNPEFLGKGDDLHIVEKQIAASTSFANTDLTPQFLELGALYCVMRTKKFAELNDNTSLGSSLHSSRTNSVTSVHENDLLNKRVDFDVEMITANVEDVYRFWVHDDNLMRIKIQLLKHLDLVANDINDETDDTLVEFLDSKDLLMARQMREPAEIRAVSGGRLESDTMLVIPAGGLRHMGATQLDSATLGKIIHGTAEVDRSAPIHSQLAIGWVVSHQAVPTLSIKTKRTRFKSDDIYVAIDTDVQVVNTDLQFPYSVLELRVKSNNDWVDSLRKSELLYPVSPSFSLYLWALCSMEPGLVLSQPSWLTDLDQGKSILREPEAIKTPKNGITNSNLNSNLSRKKSLASIKIQERPANRYWNEFDDGDEYQDTNDQYIDGEEEQMRRAEVASRLTMPVYQLGESMRRKLHGLFDRRNSSSTLDSEFAAMSMRSQSSNNSSSSENNGGQYSPRIRPRSYGSFDDPFNLANADLEAQKRQRQNDHGIKLITFLAFSLSAVICFLVFMLFFTEQLDIMPMGLRLVLILFLAVALLVAILGYIAHNLRIEKTTLNEIIVNITLLCIVCLTVGGIANLALPSV